MPGKSTAVHSIYHPQAVTEMASQPAASLFAPGIPSMLARRPASSLLCLLLAVCAVLGLEATASAATSAPQLLPYTVSIVAGGAAASPKMGASCGTGSNLIASNDFGDGCLATQVLLSVPRAVAVDTQGNVFVVDSANSSIRRVDARTGIISTFAGGASATPASGASCASGSALKATGTLGDGCLATQVKLAAPEGITVDAQDNVWFTDFNLGAVRTVSRTTGIITTIVNSAGTLGYRAGNVSNPGVVVPAAQGMLQKPYGLTFDNAGNLYIADNYNNLVDVVNLSASAVTVAGNSIPAGAIFTIAGAGCTYGTTGCASAYGKTNGVSTASLLDSPYQVAVDNAGNIYIADEYPYDVRVINTSGIMSTYANSAQTKSASITRGPAVSTPLANTYGVATDAAGNLYIAVYDSTSTSGYLDRVDVATGIIYPVGGQLTATPAPTAPGVAANGATYCSAKTDAVGDGCPGTQASFYKPFQPFADAAGNLYVVDQGNNLIRKLSPGTQFPGTGQPVGTTTTQIAQIHLGVGETLGSASVTAGSDFSVSAPACAAANSDSTTDCLATVTFKASAPGVRTAALTVKSASGLTGSFAVTGTGLAAVLSLDPGVQTTLAAQVTAVASLALDGSGNTYAAVPGLTSIQKYSPAGTASSVGSGISQAVAVAVDPQGDVFAALSSGTVVEVPANGSAQIIVGSGFTKLSGIAADSLGNVYVADGAANQVVEINSKTGVQRVLATASSAALSGPTGLAVDPAGNLFISNTIANNIVELPFKSAAPIVLGSGLNLPAGIAVDAAGSLYIADSKNGRVVLIPNESGTLNTADQIAIITGLTAPSGIAVANSGAVTVADSSLNAIYTYTRNAGTIAFGNDPVGTQLTAPADLVSTGNQAVTLATAYDTATGNTSDFTLTPSTLTSGTTLAAGLAVPLTAGFKPTVAGARAAGYTFNATNAATPTLNLTGQGITPTNATTTTISATPAAGTYGQTVAATFTVATTTGAVPTGTVNVKVDTTSYTPTLAGGTVTIQILGLGAGTHTITAVYPGDSNDTPSTASPFTVTLGKAPLTIAVNNATKAYQAALPTFTGTLTGLVNNDQISVTYTTTAVASSPLGTYPINATPSASASTNYNVTVTPGTLTIVKAGTNVLLASSATSVSGTTAVTLTATVTSQTAGAPSGSVTFFNGATAIGAAVTLNAQGIATLTTSFVLVGQSTSNVITAVYSGDGNYTNATSNVVTIVAATAGFNLTGTSSALTVVQGQTAITSFTLTPTFAYSGTIGFACTGLPATIGCSFSPTTVSPNGTNAASLITVSFSTVQPAQLAQRTAPVSSRKELSAVAFAGIPGMLLLAGTLLRRRGWKTVRKTQLFVLAGLISVMLLSASGCGNGHFTSGTPVGSYAINVVATGTPGSGTVNVVQQFTVTLKVQ